jgi:hypothetical protein
VTSAATNIPRFDYNPTTLAPSGLLIEEARTNLIAFSSVFSNATWTLTNGLLSSNTVTAPDGTLTAYTLSATTANASVQQVRTSAIGTTYTISFWIRRKTGTGTISIRSVENANTPVTVTSTWTRFSVATVATTTTLRTGVNIATSGDEIYIWGGQAEAGAFSTSYIPTTSTPLPRAADLASMTGTNLSRWYNATQGTLFAEFDAAANSYAGYVVLSNGVTAQNSIHFDNDISGVMRAVYYSSSVAVATLSLGAIGTVGTNNAIASAYKVDDFAASRNGGTVVAVTSGAVPVSLTQLNIGADPSGTAANVINGHMQRIVYYPTRLGNTELQTLTAV